MKTLFNSAILSLLLVSSLVSAQQDRDQDDRRGPPKQPPQEAIDACADKVENETVTFSGRRGEEVSAICLYVEDQLVAVPENHQRRQQ